MLHDKGVSCSHHVHLKLKVCQFNRIFILRQMAKGNIPLSGIVQAGKDSRPIKLGLVNTSHIPLMELPGSQYISTQGTLGSSTSEWQSSKDDQT